MTRKVASPPASADPAPAAPSAGRPAKKRAQSATKRAPQPARLDAPAQLWQAFDEAVALLPADPALPLLWCSPAFAQHLAPAGGTPGAAPDVATLCRQLEGLAAGLAALGVAVSDPSCGGDTATGKTDVPPVAAWQGAVHLRAAQGTGAWWHAALRRLADGTLALRLQPEHEQDRATRRHLEDREQLLFTSRSIAVGEMATTLAHELNQPLGAVTNVLRGLKTRLSAAVVQQNLAALPSLEQGVQLALDQVQYASRIIGRIRDYTQSRQPRRERVDLNALLHNSLTLLDWDLQRHGVQLQLQLPTLTGNPAQVVGDGVMLQQVLVNLLRNAIDAMTGTPPGERRLDITSRIEDARQIEIAIADTGCGIGEEGASQLFMPFYSTKPTGMGIGLNICRSLIELHQGRLWYTPNDARGCTFHLALPLALAGEADQLPRFLDAEESVS